jgi:hypothetical protein
MKIPLLVLVVAVLAVPARAHDWRATRAETAEEFRRARAEAKLGCAEMNALIDQQRMFANQSSLARIPSYLLPQMQPARSAAPTSGARPAHGRTR